jgi:hypothetical protein
MVWYEQAITNNSLIWTSNNKQQSDMNKHRCLLLLVHIRPLLVIVCSYQIVVCYCLLISDRCLLLLAHIRPLFIIVCSYQTVVCYCLLISDRCLLLLAYIRPLFVIVCSYQTAVCYCLLISDRCLTNNGLIWTSNNKQRSDMSKQ